ncbi:MAG TPA: response regulator transcription factor [Anaeromyxobacteraceae bacterium]|nr:response regulator transcription factor [Anaeromyxobacteraceae bacterium]
MMQILLADDHELLLQGVRAVLEAEPDWLVCGTARDGCEAVELAARFLPDVAVLDLAMPRLNGLEAARQIRRESPSTRVLVLTGSHSDELWCDAWAAGASGYVLKGDGVAALIAGVRAVAEGRPFFGARPLHDLGGGGAPAGPGGLRRLRGQSPHSPSLTPREREIAQLLAEGKTNWCVASILGISIKTVETHRAHIMQKLGCESFAELVRYAVRNLMVAP